MIPNIKVKSQKFVYISKVCVLIKVKSLCTYINYSVITLISLFNIFSTRLVATVSLNQVVVQMLLL